MQIIQRSDDTYEIILSDIESRMTVYGETLEEAKINYCNAMIDMLKKALNMPMPEVKPVKVDMSDEEIQELNKLLKESPVTLLPKHNYNDEKSQGWYHVDAEDDTLNICIHRDLWLDTLHTGDGTSAFYDETGKVWLIPTRSIKFLHPYKNRKA